MISITSFYIIFEAYIVLLFCIAKPVILISVKMGGIMMVASCPLVCKLDQWKFSTKVLKKIHFRIVIVSTMGESCRMMGVGEEQTTERPTGGNAPSLCGTRVCKKCPYLRNKCKRVPPCSVSTTNFDLMEKSGRNKWGRPDTCWTPPDLSWIKTKLNKPSVASFINDVHKIDSVLTRYPNVPQGIVIYIVHIYIL